MVGPFISAWSSWSEEIWVSPWDFSIWCQSWFLTKNTPHFTGSFGAAAGRKNVGNNTPKMGCFCPKMSFLTMWDWFDNNFISRVGKEHFSTVGRRLLKLWVLVVPSADVSGIWRTNTTFTNHHTAKLLELKKHQKHFHSRKSICWKDLKIDISGKSWCSWMSHSTNARSHQI